MRSAEVKCAFDDAANILSRHASITYENDANLADYLLAFSQNYYQVIFRIAVDAQILTSATY